MAPLLLVLSVVVPAVPATLVVCLVWPKGTSLRRELSLKAALGTGLGLGITSCAHFLWLAAFGTPAGLVAFEVTAATVVSAVALLLLKKRQAAVERMPGRVDDGVDRTTRPTLDNVPWTRTRKVLAGAFVLAVALAVTGFIVIALKGPHGGWDAWAIWNLRARFLFRGCERLADAFAPGAGRSHTDYPLLVPSSVARAWSWAGGETVLGPAFVAAAFTFAMYLLGTFAVASVRGTAQGLAAGLVLVGTAHITSSGAMQFADVPIGFFVLATAVMIVLRKEWGREGRPALVVAGLAAGLAAWTKNEGLAFVVAAAIALVVPAFCRSRRQDSLKDLAWFALGAAPALTVVVCFKLRFSPGSEYLDQGLVGALAGFGEFRRYVKVGGAMLRQLPTFGNGAMLVLAAYAALAGLARPERKRRFFVPAAALALTLCAYVAAYMISPYDLDWHLATSLRRLLLHLWPGIVFLAFLVIAPIERNAVPA